MEDDSLDRNMRELYPTTSIFKIENREASKRPRLESASSTEDGTILMVNNGKNQTLRYWVSV